MEGLWLQRSGGEWLCERKMCTRGAQEHWCSLCASPSSYMMRCKQYGVPCSVNPCTRTPPQAQGTKSQEGQPPARTAPTPPRTEQQQLPRPPTAQLPWLHQPGNSACWAACGGSLGTGRLRLGLQLLLQQWGVRGRGCQQVARSWTQRAQWCVKTWGRVWAPA